MTETARLDPWFKGPKRVYYQNVTAKPWEPSELLMEMIQTEDKQVGTSYSPRDTEEQDLQKLLQVNKPKFQTGAILSRDSETQAPTFDKLMFEFKDKIKQRQPSEELSQVNPFRSIKQENQPQSKETTPQQAIVHQQSSQPLSQISLGQSQLNNKKDLIIIDILQEVKNSLSLQTVLNYLKLSDNDII